MGRYFINRPVAAMALAMTMVLLGIVSLNNLAIEQYPDITPPVVEISATYPGADATIVNDAVATPIAQSLMGTDNMIYMQATSANDGTMSLEATFDIGTSPDTNVILAQNNLSSATSQLPDAVRKQGVVAQKTNRGFLMVYALSSDGRYDGEWLSNYAYINIRSELQKISGVGKVEVMGAGEYAMRIWLHPDKIHLRNLTLQQIQASIEAQSGVHPAGKFGAEPSSGNQRFTFTVTMPAEITTVEEFSNIVVAIDENGGEILLSDIADVELGAESYGTHSLFDDNPSALIVVYQQPGSNAVLLGEQVRNAISNLETRFPDGLHITSIVDATTNIRAGIEDIVRTLIIALLLVIVVIYLFLQSWRATIIPIVAIPVSLIGCFALFPVLGFSVNIISLLGLVLAIGLVVDDAIVVVEAVSVNISRGMSARDATIEAMRRVSSPIIATTLVLLAVFIPISLMGGISSLIFRQFSITIAITVTLSAINALTLSPALCSMLLKPQSESRGHIFSSLNSLLNRSIKSYNRITSIFVRHIWRTLTLTVVLGAVIFGGFKTLPEGFLSNEDQGYLMVVVDAPDNTSLNRTVAIMQSVDRVVRNAEGVEATAIAAGYDMLSGVASTSCGAIFTLLKPYDERSLSADDIAHRITQQLNADISSAECFAFTPPAIPGLGVTSGLSAEIEDLEGRGYDYLEEQASHLIDELRKNKSIASVSMQYRSNIGQRHLAIDIKQAELMGVNPSDIFTMLSTYLGGSYLGTFNRFGQQYQIYIQADSASRRDARSLERYYITNVKGDDIPITSFVDVRDTTGVEYLTQFNLRNSIPITITPAPGASTGDVMALVESVARTVFPNDVALAWSGMAYQESVASSSEWLSYLIALSFVFLALAVLYNSWSLPIAILLSVPAALAGGILFVSVAHLLSPDYINNIYMQIALIMLIGLAAKNAILVVEYAEQEFRSGKSLFDATCAAASERVRPIIMTAFAFILGALPLIFATGAYSTARHILGLALGGGMLVATILGIFIYPASYYLIGRLARFERNTNHK